MKFSHFFNSLQFYLRKLLNTYFVEFPCRRVRFLICPLLITSRLPRSELLFADSGIIERIVFRQAYY